ncbi:MAG: hypothetical protein JXR68_07150 [Bacteroidales bacterium]|nr:hypothetical protein [Bacteroidales bacterium]
MKQLLILVSVLIIFSCNNKKNNTFDNPQEYNDALVKIVENVQVSVDSLEQYLVHTKLRLETTPNTVFFTHNEIDTALLNKLLTNSKNKITLAFSELQDVNYFEDDASFKKSIITGFEILDKTLSNDFRQLIDTLMYCDSLSYNKVVYAMLPKGKQSYNNFSAAFDTIIVGQQKFDMKNNYILEDNFIKFNF